MGDMTTSPTPFLLLVQEALLARLAEVDVSLAALLAEQEALVARLAKVDVSLASVQMTA